jgi:hypothetical protein
MSSNMISSHLNKEDKFGIRTVKPVGEESYEAIKVDGDLTIFTSREQLEQLFNKLDKHLHKKTYTVLEDECLNMESSLEKANERIEDLEDMLQEK